MKKNEIKVGGHYTAKIGGRLTTVRVDAIRDDEEVCGTRNASGRPRKAANSYDVTNLATGRKTTFRSAAKFRNTVSDAMARREKTFAKFQKQALREIGDEPIQPIEMHPAGSQVTPTSMPLG